MSKEIPSSQNSFASTSAIPIEDDIIIVGEQNMSDPSTECRDVEGDRINPYERKKRKKTSKVWDEFKEITLADGSTRFQCVHCRNNLTGVKFGATTHLLRHLKSCVSRKIAMRGQ